MENYLFYSYLSSTIGYCALFLLTILKKRRNGLLILAALCSTIWSASILAVTQINQFFLAETLIFETLRNITWYLLLSSLLSNQQWGNSYQFIFHFKFILPATLFLSFVSSIETFPDFLEFIQHSMNFDPRFFAHLFCAVIGLILTEQLYRNTPLQQRWHIKFLCLSIGTMFAIDLIVYSKSLLYEHLDLPLWHSRGFINAVTTTFLVFSLPRLDSLNLTPSPSTPRKTVFYSTILFGCGIYLILMSLVGYFLKKTNTNWGESLQTVFIFLAILLLILTFTSGKIRALTKVYFGKHFFHYSYDYREEWLKISKALAKLESLDELKHFIITTLTDLVESSGGGLWLKNDQGHFFLAAEQNLHLTTQELDSLRDQHYLPVYLTNKQWVIDFYELAHAPEVYDDIDLSPWCYEDSEVWLIVPLFHLNHLEAFAILTQPRVPRKLNWEDHDLLKTVGMQLANAIALNKVSEALANNRQFETYHRLSAYLVHDLKNISAQIALIVKNADKHKLNPEFIDDTIDTLKHSVNKMQHIVEQLKQGKSTPLANSKVNLSDIIKKIQQQQNGFPSIQSDIQCADCIINIDQNKLITVLSNLVQNAQDASQKHDGWVKLVLTTTSDYAVIKIIDNGTGMEPSFIAERLFKPFDTTKGNAGMGIGAYEAKDFILKNAGQLDVESQFGQGTTFTIRFPLLHSIK
ncbi:MAG: PEP-CTERM system histidine kinase PrsK [Methylomonas sp.]|jgi:putative PEP-CTERM system histidine kinase|uniref:XrtA/PEP-CTERM system histidine kinase PrsK n=1 Tax=Methylomonas sp. TaxID=418 RepID=UPI0025E95A6A|nr:XrtA/PEP-CTERM system histidine kinase PrsK [Methylomonas sp.]MCK9606011.1 PEP-CTERM system histidine kinase PrsK [Methylomonas sp.]